MSQRISQTLAGWLDPGRGVQADYRAIPSRLQMDCYFCASGKGSTDGVAEHCYTGELYGQPQITTAN